MFTQRAALLGFVAFCFYLIAVVNSLSGYYYALTWLSMAMLAACLGVALLSLMGLKCQLEVTRSRGAAGLGIEPGSGALVALSVSNAGTLNKTNVVLEIRVQNSRKELQSLRFLIEALPSGAAIESVLPLASLRRGQYELQDARLVGSDVLGLFRTQKKLGWEAHSVREISVGPPILKSEVLQGGGNGFSTGQQRALSVQNGDELRGTRPYAPGDDLRHVHWKSSARAGELVVKEWEQSGQSSALVIWDGAAQTAWGGGDWESGEWGLILSASLCHAFLSGDTPCDFVRLDAEPTLVQTRALSRGELPVALTDALSGAEANRILTLQSALWSLPHFAVNPGSKAIVVSASLSSDLVGGVRNLRARGVQVQVFLIDAASVAERGGDRKFRVRAAKLSVFKAPTQSDGDKTVPVTGASFNAQAARLREIGALVVSVRAHEEESAETTLRAALHAAGQTSGSSREE